MALVPRKMQISEIKVCPEWCNVIKLEKEFQAHGATTIAEGRGCYHYAFRASRMMQEVHPALADHNHLDVEIPKRSYEVLMIDLIGKCHK